MLFAPSGVNAGVTLSCRPNQLDWDTKKRESLDPGVILLKQNKQPHIDFCFCIIDELNDVAHSSVWLKRTDPPPLLSCAFSSSSFDKDLTTNPYHAWFFSCLTLFHTDMDAQRMATCPVLTVPNLTHGVLVLQFKYWPRLRQTLKTRMRIPHMGILNHWDGLCHSNQTCDETPAFLLWW